MADTQASTMPGMTHTPCTTRDPALVDHPALTLLSDCPTREQIESLGAFLESIEGGHPAPDISTAHYFVGEVYGRSVTIPAETFLVGLPHKADHLNVCVGDITVWTERGRERFTGAHVVKGRAGQMRVGFAHADTTWLSVHANHTGGEDLAAIEASLIENPDRLLSRRRSALECAR